MHPLLYSALFLATCPPYAFLCAWVHFEAGPSQAVCMSPCVDGACCLCSHIINEHRFELLTIRTLIIEEIVPCREEEHLSMCSKNLTATSSFFLILRRLLSLPFPLPKTRQHGHAKRQVAGRQERHAFPANGSPRAKQRKEEDKNGCVCLRVL